jgi:hypothetical protein
MATLPELIVELVTSTLRLVVVFTTEVALREPFDPLALASLASGTVFTLVAVGVFGYLVLGAALEAVGVDVGSPGRTPPPERQRG